MEWVREWILQIAAVIVLGAICDIIMIEGEMKKYVNPILGVVLIFTIIRPITSVSGNMLRADMFQQSIESLYADSYETEEKQLSHIADMYEKNLSKKIEKSISNKFGNKSSITTLSDRQKGNLGSINNIEAAVWVNEGEFVNTESIKRHIEEVFGVDREHITVTLKKKG